jgi:hypothetical protein
MIAASVVLSWDTKHAYLCVTSVMAPANVKAFSPVGHACLGLAILQHSRISPCRPFFDDQPADLPAAHRSRLLPEEDYPTSSPHSPPVFKQTI